jgi:hypothetical protein
VRLCRFCKRSVVWLADRCSTVPAPDGLANVINDAVDDAQVVLPAYDSGRVEEMSVQAIDGDAKPERRGKAVLGAATKVQGGVVNLAYIQTATRALKCSGNPCPAGQYMSRRAQRVAAPDRKRRTEQVAEHTSAMSTVGHTRSARVTKVQFSRNATAAISDNANVRSGQSGATRRRNREIGDGIPGAEDECGKATGGDRRLLYGAKGLRRGSPHRQYRRGTWRRGHG